jgi:translation elongation factor EF-1beta
MENRFYPRIDASFPIQVTPSILGETRDISETGMSMIFKKPLLLTKAIAKIEFKNNINIETEFKIIWGKQLIEKNNMKYGVCFLRLEEKNLDKLRQLLISHYLVNVLRYIDKLEIKNAVKEFYVNDLYKYMKDFEDIEFGLKKNKRSIDASYIMLKNITDRVLQRGDSVEGLVGKKVVIKRIKESFRCLCGPLAYKGKLVKRAFEKPREYPGDYLTIEYVYDNKSISKGVGLCCDRYFLDDKYAIAVRNRKDKMKDILIGYISGRQSETMNILNIACGSCREIKDMFSIENIAFGKTRLTLVDQDEEALIFSKQSLSKCLPKDVKMFFLQHDITNYIKENNKYSSILGKHDLIYSIGLADYLPDGIFKRILYFLFGQLQDKGTLIFAHKDIDKYNPISTDWWCNWTFYSRNEKKVLELISNCGIHNVEIKLEREKSGLIIFFIISKK